MASLQLIVQTVLAFIVLVQSSQDHKFGCSTGKCDAELWLGSSVEESSNSISGYMCTSNCYKAGYSYYWCDADRILILKAGSEFGWNGWPISHGWDYCSPWENTDITGKECARSHPCGNHGYGYRWCYTNSGHTEWNYCSKKQKVKMPKVILPSPCNHQTEGEANRRCI